MERTPFASDTATVMADDVLTVLGTPGPVKQLHMATESACWLQTCNGDAGESRLTIAQPFSRVAPARGCPYGR